jgi:hypothetical protein
MCTMCVYACMHVCMYILTSNDHAMHEDPSCIVPSIKGSPNIPTTAGAAHTGRGLAKSVARDSPLRCWSISFSRCMLNMLSTRSVASAWFVCMYVCMCVCMCVCVETALDAVGRFLSRAVC